ncbi:MAG: hypothetical protein PHC68_16470 [Syntrophorhabdaceae bacterium]|nr:hypothetical protein [Syntrophorhabdaceae bacterium]
MKACINCGEESNLLWDDKFCGNCDLCKNCSHLTTKDYRGILGISLLDYCAQYGYWKPHYWRCAGFSKKGEEP